MKSSPKIVPKNSSQKLFSKNAFPNPIFSAIFSVFASQPEPDFQNQMVTTLGSYFLHIVRT